MSEPQKIVMSDRERALYLAGCAAGHAKGLDEAAAHCDKVVGELSKFRGGMLLREHVEQLAGVVVAHFKPKLKGWLKRPVIGPAYLEASFGAIAGDATELHAKLAGYVAGVPGQLRDAANQRRLEFARLLSEVPKPAGLVARLAKRALGRLAGA